MAVHFVWNAVYAYLYVSYVGVEELFRVSCAFNVRFAEEKENSLCRNKGLLTVVLRSLIGDLQSGSVDT